VRTAFLRICWVERPYGNEPAGTWMFLDEL
jgi:hypothetical protein